MSATPNAMPARKNQLRVQLLDALIAVKPETWDRKTIDPETADQKKPGVIKTKVTNHVLRFPLARNVNGLNVQRAVQRWVA